MGTGKTWWDSSINLFSLVCLLARSYGGLSEGLWACSSAQSNATLLEATSLRSTSFAMSVYFLTLFSTTAG